MRAGVVHLIVFQDCLLKVFPQIEMARSFVSWFYLYIA